MKGRKLLVVTVVVFIASIFAFTHFVSQNQRPNRTSAVEVKTENTPVTLEGHADIQFPERK